jgi:hypothetical protein
MFQSVQISCGQARSADIPQIPGPSGVILRPPMRCSKRNSIAIGPLAGKMTRHLGLQRGNSQVSCPSKRTSVVVVFRVLACSAGYAGAGSARSRAISDKVSANICLDTATSAIWNVA